MKYILIDLDGVLRKDNELLPGAQEFLSYISTNQIPSCILSNSTKFSSKNIVDFFASISIELSIPIITAVDVTANYLLQNHKTASVYCVESAKKYLSVLPDAANPEVVVIGDMADGWTYPLLNEMFKKVMNGAQIIAMQKNKFGAVKNDLYLDAGAFISAIEYASGTYSKLIGKPSKEYFELALQKAGGKPGDEFMMIGDDLLVDIEAAQKLGGKGVLLLTGKTNENILKSQVAVKPDLIFYNLFTLLESKII